MVGRGYFFYGPAYFQGQTVSFREGTLRAHRSTNQPIAWHRWPRCLLLQATLLQVAILEHIPPKPLKKQFFFLSHSSILTGLFEYIRCCEKSLFLEVKLLSFSTSDLFRDSASLKVDSPTVKCLKPDTPWKIHMDHVLMEVWFRSFSFLNGWWL